MPLYEYHCLKCGRFETLQKFSDGPLAACPTCGGTVERLISAPAFQFKGTGWYVTDYGKSGAEAPGSKEPGAKGSDSKSSEGASGSASSKETSTPTSADSKSSTNSPPKESAASAAPALAPTANTSQ
ncbi:MAG TPA: zinc ribbon domain-containing protein [Vicinamibacteria bacterium]|nr:zinc ribbon domain-containing protein [Vicinamibacteria bacterium]